MKTGLFALGAALALAAGAPALAGGAPADAGSAAAPAHRFVAAPGQEDESIVGFVDMASLRRTGATAEADGLLVPTAEGMTPYPDYVTGHMRIDCVTRIASVSDTRRVTLGGADAGPGHSEVASETVGHDPEEEATFALFCTAGAADSLPGYATAEAAVQSARSDPVGKDEGGGDEEGEPATSKT